METGKTVLIAGASRGLGWCLAKKYLEDGWNVLAGVRDEGCKGMKELKALYPENLIPLQMDIKSTESVRSAAETVSGLGGRIDVIINCAGIHGKTSRVVLEEAEPDDCLEVYDINAVGPLRVVKAFLPMLTDDGNVLIVNISSESGSISTAGREKEFDYCMSKAAMNMETKLLDNYLGKRGIRVIAVHPGWMRTDMGGANADLDPYETACKLAALFASQMGKKDGTIFMDNEGNAYPW